MVRASAVSERERKIILVLVEHQSAKDDFIVAYRTTQAGLAERTGIAQPHVSSALKALRSRGLVAQRVAHIEGVARPKASYSLTETGLALARELAASMLRFVQHPAGLAPPKLFIGRDQETATALKWFRDGRPRALYVRGLAGIGKTTLVEATLAALRGEADLFYYRVRPWSTVAHLLHELAELLRQRDEYGLRNYIAAATAGGRPLDPGLGLFHLERGMSGSRALLAVDDYHDSADDLGEFVAGLLEVVERVGGRMLVAGRETRPPFDVRAAASGRFVELRLDGLDPETVKRILEKRGAALTVTPEVAARIQRMTGGNPLFVRLLSASGPVEGASDIQSYLSREVDRGLDERDRRLLGRLAAFRRPVPAEAFSGLPDRSAIRRLVEKSLVSVRRPPGLYTMHELLRGHFYGRLGDAERREANAAAAEHYAGSPEPEVMVEQLLHLHLAGDSPGFLALLHAHGDEMVTRGQATELRSLIEAPVFDQQAVVWRLRAACHRMTGQVEKACRECEEGLKVPEEPVGRLRILAEQARCLSLVGRLDESTLACRSGLALLARAPAGRERDLLELRLRRMIAIRLRHRMRYRESARLLRWCLGRASRLGSVEEQAGCHNNLAVALAQGGDRPGAVAHFEKALRGMRQWGDVAMAGLVLSNLGMARRGVGDLTGSVEAAGEALRLSESVGDRENVAVAFDGLATVQVDFGQAELAREYFERARVLADALGNRYLAARLAVSRAEGLARLADPDGAEVAIASVRGLATGQGDSELAYRLARVRGRAAAQRGDDAGCREAIDECAQREKASGRSARAIDVALMLAILHHARGDDREAARKIDDLLGARATAAWPLPEAIEAQELAGVVCLSCGDTARARKLLSSAAKFWSDAGAPGPAERCRRSIPD